jgi:hypothetical protein
VHRIHIKVCSLVWPSPRVSLNSKVSNPFSDPNWSTAVVDFIDRWLGFVRDHTTRPLIAIIRGLVFGTMALVGVMFCVVLLLIGIMRALVSLGDVWLSHDTAVWVAYFVLGAIFLALGAFGMRKRHPRD